MRRSGFWSVWRVGAAAAVLGFSALAFGQYAKPETSQQGRPEGAKSAQQAATLAKDNKYSLRDSVSAAERHCGGRAVRAECLDDADRGAVCVVTLLVGDKRLVEATVSLESGAVVSQRDLDTVRVVGLAPAGVRHDDDFAMARRWQKATDLTGKRVVNAAGEELGHLKDIVVDADSGRILYGVLSFGGWLGMGDKLFAIPWPELNLPEDGKTLVLNVEKDRLRKAPGFDQQHWPDLGDEQFVTTTFKHFNREPYWRSGTRSPHTAADGPAGSRERYRQRWNLRTATWQKTSDLCGKTVRSGQTDNVGTLSDLAIDPDCGRVLYGVLSHRGKLFAIPWPALILSSDYRQLVLNADPDQLRDTVSFESNNWPNMADPNWAEEAHAYFRVEPYWTSARTERSRGRP
jgi:sporulation protein YlmC with PRC-barrel domain